MMQTRAQEEPAQRPAALYYMYDHLQYAAIKAGVPKEDLRRQLWVEYVNLLAISNLPQLIILKI